MGYSGFMTWYPWEHECIGVMGSSTGHGYPIRSQNQGWRSNTMSENSYVQSRTLNFQIRHDLGGEWQNKRTGLYKESTEP